MMYFSFGGQDNTPALTTDNTGHVMMSVLSINSRVLRAFISITHSYTTTGGNGASEYTFQGLLNGNIVYTVSNVTVKSPNKIAFTWNHIDEIVVTTVSGTTIDLGAFFDNIVYRPLSSALTDVLLSNTAIAENSNTHTTVDTCSITVADDTSTDALIAGTGSAENTSFTIDGNALKLNNIPLVIKIKSTHSTRVRSTDSGGLNCGICSC